jgi:hypothetical protein
VAKSTSISNHEINSAKLCSISLIKNHPLLTTIDCINLEAVSNASIARSIGNDECIFRYSCILILLFIFMVLSLFYLSTTFEKMNIFHVILSNHLFTYRLLNRVLIESDLFMYVRDL